MNLNDGSHRTTNNLNLIRSSSSQRTGLNSHNLIANLDIRSNWESTFNLGCNCRCTIRAYYTEGVITNFNSLRRIQNIIIIEGVKSSSNKFTQTISENEEFLSQSQETACGTVLYTGMDSDGDFYIGITFCLNINLTVSSQ